MDEKERKLKTTKFFIEATNFEQFEIWRANKDIYEQDHMGFSQVIGHINDDKRLPVNLSFMFAKLHNIRVCFYDVVSRYSDSVMVEEWIVDNYPVYYDDTRIAITNATNFHHAIDACKKNEFDR